jgi:hypothetical protein
MVDFLITPASGTAAISDSSGVSTTPGANKLWASGTNLYWGTTQVDGGGGGTIGGTVASGYIPVASATDTLANGVLFTSGATESMYIGATPGTLNAANYNTTLGYQAGDDMTEGDENTLIGQMAGMNVTTGDANTMIGRGAGTFMTTQINNTYVGSQAGYSAAGQYNTFVGALAGYNTSSDLGNMNIFVGYGAAQNMQGAAERNIAIGTYAMYSDTDAASSTAHNIAIGHESMKEISTGYNNIAIGRETLLDTKSGYMNVAVGYQAGYNVTTGHTNTMVGGQAARGLTTALGNTAIGYDSLYKTTIGGENVAVGKMAGYNYAGTTSTLYGAFSTFLGYGAGYAVTGGNSYGWVIAIGHQPMYNATGANKSIALGNSALVSGTDALDVIAIGQNAGSYADATGSVYIGNKAGFRTSGNYNTAIGYRAMSGSSSGDTSHNNVAIGYTTMEDSTSANENVIIGNFAGSEITTGDYNTAIGYAALRYGETTNRQVAVGYAALSKFTQSGDLRNTAVGMYAMLNPRSGSNNVAMGYGAMQGDDSVYDSDYNVALGSDSLFAIQGGNNNTAVGYQAGYAVTTGYDNTIVGTSAGATLTTGYYNTYIGKTAGSGATTAAHSNVGIGLSALSSAHGAGNVAIGRGALSSTTDANQVAIGYSALEANTSGEKNTAIGYQALAVNTTGNYNTAIGHEALESNVHGHRHTAVGYEALMNTATADNDGYDTAVGYQAGRLTTTGRYNVYMGTEAGYSNTDTDQNVMIGYGAGYSATATENVMIGSQAGYDSVAGNYNVFLGAKAASNATGVANSVIIGRQAAGAAAATGDDNVIMGYKAGYDLTSGYSNVLMGYSAGENITDIYENVMIGYQAGYSMKSQTTHGRMVLVGHQAGYNIDGTDKESTTAVGWRAGFNDKMDNPNTVFGGYAGYNLSGSGDGCIAIGIQTLQGDSGGLLGSGTVAVGQSIAESATKTKYDVFIGNRAAANLGNESIGNTVIGFDAGRQLGNTADAQYNVILGYQAGYYLGKTEGGVTGVASTGNIAIGREAGIKNSGGSYNVYIGWLAGPASQTTESYKLYINNAASATPLIGGDFNTNTVEFNGTVEFNDSAGNRHLTIMETGTNNALLSGADSAGLHFATQSGTRLELTGNNIVKTGQTIDNAQVYSNGAVNTATSARQVYVVEAVADPAQPAVTYTTTLNLPDGNEGGERFTVTCIAVGNFKPGTGALTGEVVLGGTFINGTNFTSPTITSFTGATAANTSVMQVKTYNFTWVAAQHGISGVGGWVYTVNTM